MDSQNNSSEYCNITEAKYDNWRSILPNCTLPTFNATDGTNGTTPSFHQTCTISETYPKVNSTECPLTVYPNCVLTENYSSNLKFPFLQNGTTTEECECTGLNLQNISRSDMFRCTCMHDLKHNITSEAGNSHPNNYVFMKNCTADSVTNNTLLNSMNCTFTDCDYSWENGFFNITNNQTQRDNGTYPAKFIANITDRKIIPTSTQGTPGTSRVSVSATGAPSAVPSTSGSTTEVSVTSVGTTTGNVTSSSSNGTTTVTNSTSHATTKVTPTTPVSQLPQSTTATSTTTNDESGSASGSFTDISSTPESTVAVSSHGKTIVPSSTVAGSPDTTVSSQPTNGSTVSHSQNSCNTSCPSTITVSVTSETSKQPNVTNGSTIVATSVGRTTSISTIGSTPPVLESLPTTAFNYSTSTTGITGNTRIVQSNQIASFANGTFGNNAVVPILLLLFYLFTYLGLYQKETILIRKKYN